MINLFTILSFTHTLSPVQTVSLKSDTWKTTYERSGYVSTGRYLEAVKFCKSLAKLSPYANVIDFGTSPEGRSMIALVISKGKAQVGSKARKKPVIFVNNGIHSGEIEGKDASLILARDILIAKKYPRLLDTLDIVIVPVFSVDAHERFSAYNRINQNGPKEMGWRATSQNLNLNRDWVKADALEMRAMLQLLNKLDPDFFFDNHTTDGGDWQYSIQTDVPAGPEMDQDLAKWSREMLAGVTPKVEGDGFLMCPYFGGVNAADPGRGISVDEFSPRYSTGYMATQNRPSMLVETHMLKPYKHRVEATYSIVLRTLEYCSEHSTDLLKYRKKADKSDTELKPDTSIVLTSKLSNVTRPFTFKGYKYTPYKSDVSGGMTHKWLHEAVDTPTSMRDTFEPGLSVNVPAAYAIPPQWTEVIRRLKAQGFEMHRLKSGVSKEFDSWKLNSVRFPAMPFESHFMPAYTAQAIRETRELPAGTVIVPTNQSGARLVMHMLEPNAPDSLLRWGFFNVVFEQKEYFEDYSMEPIAKKILDNNPLIQTEFQEKLKDTAFANSPRARLDFFFQRSPYLDARLGKYPVVRLSTDELKSIK